MDVVRGVAVMILTFVGGGLGGWFGSYFKKKGENRALKEDIKGLTEAVEGVKAQFEEDAAKRQREHTIFLETFKSEQALRVLAGPERLKAHQEAFTWWRTLWDQSEDLAVIDQAISGGGTSVCISTIRGDIRLTRVWPLSRDVGCYWKT